MAKHHPNKEISEAIEYALAHGWRFEKVKTGHAYGRIYCPASEREDVRSLFGVLLETLRILHATL